MSEHSAERSGSTGPSGTEASRDSRSRRCCDVAVVGGGEAGLTVAQELQEHDDGLEIVLIEPSSHHYDQPQWLRVGTEGVREEATRSRKEEHVPASVDWIQEPATAIEATDRVVVLDGGDRVRYGYLVIATGIGTRWNRIRGLEGHLGTRDICSVYGPEEASRTWEMIQSFEGGQAVFTAPSGPYKGGHTPLDVLRRAEAVWRDTGVLSRTEITFATAADGEFATSAHSGLAAQARREDGIRVYTGYDLVEVRPEPKEAVFRVAKGKARSQDVLRYDLLHVVPPMRPPSVVEKSSLSHWRGPMRGFLDVHSDTLRHKRFDTVFGVGDVVGIKDTKTGEQAREHALVVARILQRALEQDD